MDIEIARGYIVTPTDSYGYKYEDLDSSTPHHYNIVIIFDSHKFNFVADDPKNFNNLMDDVFFNKDTVYPKDKIEEFSVIINYRNL